MDINELLQLKYQIENKCVDLQTAKEVLFQHKNIKSWHTKEWKTRRLLVLKDKCEQCGSTEVLTLQHKIHPRQYGECKYIMICRYGEKYNLENPINELVPEQEVFEWYNKMPKKQIKVCPKCNYASIRERKTMKPKYVCGKCSYAFNKCNIVLSPILIDDRLGETSKIGQSISFSELRKNIYKQKCKISVQTKYEYEIERDTLLLLIEEYLKYLSFEGTSTLCKKCAFNYDINHSDLCPICKKAYKKIGYKTCWECRENYQ